MSATTSHEGGPLKASKARKVKQRAAHAARLDNRRPKDAPLLSDLRAKAKAERRDARRAKAREAA